MLEKRSARIKLLLKDQLIKENSAESEIILHEGELA